MNGDIRVMDLSERVHDAALACRGSRPNVLVHLLIEQLQRERTIAENRIVEVANVESRAEAMVRSWRILSSPSL